MFKLKFLPFYTLAILPFKVLYGLSDISYLILYHIVRYRRIIVRKNLVSSFPNKSIKEIIKIEKQFYRNFSDTIFEVIKGLTMSRKTAEQRVLVDNKQLMEDLYEQKKQVLLCAGHQTNWEWGLFTTSTLPYQNIIIYQPLSSNYFDDLIKAVRNRQGRCIKASKWYRYLVTLKHEKKQLQCHYILGDQSPQTDDPTYWTNFLNQKTAFITGIGKAASKAGLAVVFAAHRKPKRGNYIVTLTPIDVPPEKNGENEITERYVRILEKTIQQAPELWLWSHRRWKHTPPAEIEIDGDKAT